MSYTRTIQNTSGYLGLGAAAKIDILHDASFNAQRLRKQSAELRLYYHYKATVDAGGFAYFLTFTYNNKSLPDYYGIPCFNNMDIVNMLHGQPYRRICEKGWNLKYVISGELGEGKGSRGYGRNPHYHVILFITPSISAQPIVSDDEIVNLFIDYWQGTETSTYKDYRYGLVSAGCEGYRVKSFSACTYLAKYIAKDMARESFDTALSRKVSEVVDAHFSYLTDSNFNDFSVDTQPLSGMFYDDLTQSFIDPYLKGSELPKYVEYRKKKILFRKFIECKVLNEVKKLYGCPGLRHWSKGIGRDAMQYLSDDCCLPYPTKNGVKMIPAGMFFYRLRYYETYKCPHTGNYLYRLNELGVNRAQKRLYTQLNKIVENLKIARDSYSKNPIFAKSITDVFYDDEILYRYAIYKRVYQYRTFSVNSDSYYPDRPLDYVSDYTHFLSVRYDWCPTFFGDASEGISYYSEHPYFSDYRSEFARFDALLDSYYTAMDSKNREEDERRREVRRRLLKLIY